MKCLSLETIYLFLEDGLSPIEAKDVQAHLATCPRCQQLLEDRSRFLKAIKSLPRFQPPPDFTNQVMDKIFNPAIGYQEVIFSVLGLLVLVSLSLLSLVVLAGPSFLQTISQFYHQLIVEGKTWLLFLVKASKTIIVFFKLGVNLAKQGGEILTILFSWEGLGFIMVIISYLFLLSIFGLLVFRKKLFSGA